jgi:hypothetical protein
MSFIARCRAFSVMKLSLRVTHLVGVSTAP